MKLFANKLDKLGLFRFFDYSLSKKEKVSSTVIRQQTPTPLQKKLRGLGVPDFHKKSKTKKY